MNENKVYIIGAGPGAADLITVRGAKILALADVVFYDSLVGKEVLDYAANAKKIHVGKLSGKTSHRQEDINKKLISQAKSGKTVVRLKGGDAMIFGRADEELTALKKADIAVEVVAGISAASAASASLQLSLTQREISRSVAFCTLASANPFSEVVLPQADTLVIYMGRDNTAAIARTLISRYHWKKNTPVIIAQAVSTANERKLSLSLAQMAQNHAPEWIDINLPALIMVGKTFAENNNYYQNLIHTATING